MDVTRTLSVDHQYMLEVESGVSPEAIIARGYWTATDAKQLAELGFAPAQRLVPALVIAIWGVDGDIVLHQIRPDKPRERDGKPIKYETRKGGQIDLDVPPKAWTMLGDPEIPLWITEGAKKADAMVSRDICCISLLGVWGGRGRNGSGGVTELSAWDRVALKGRKIYIAFDSDAVAKRSVAEAMDRLGAMLTRRGAASVTYIYIPTTDGQKIGLDDFLAAGGSVCQLFAHGSDAVLMPELPPKPISPSQYMRTERGMSERLAAERGDDFRYVAKWESWMVWDGSVWQRDERDARDAYCAMHELVDQIISEAALIPDKSEREEHLKWALKCHTATTIKHSLELLRRHPTISSVTDDWDQHPWLFACANGTIDLRSGDLLPPRREHYITDQSPVTYDPKAVCPTWEAFLYEIQAENAEVLNYIWKAAGYSLTGVTSEQIFFFLFGEGANGKGTFIRALNHILGSYASSAAVDTFMAKGPKNGASSDIARLKSARLVTCTETDAGARLNESLIKELTGEDRITARFLFSDEFQFQPQFKIWMSGNHKPGIRGTDYGMWRRVAMVPFQVTIAPERRDPDLDRKLRAEAPGILNWMVEGCLAWQDNGLKMPASIRAFIDEYQHESDVVGRFLDEETNQVSGLSVQASVMYEAYRKWCESNGEFVLSSVKFAKAMSERGEGSVLGGSRGKIKVFLNRTLSQDDTLEGVWRGDSDR